MVVLDTRTADPLSWAPVLFASSNSGLIETSRIHSWGPLIPKAVPSLHSIHRKSQPVLCDTKEALSLVAISWAPSWRLHHGGELDPPKVEVVNR